MKGTKRDHFAEVTGKIIAQLEKGVVPWQQPWGFCEPAQNHFTGHRYRGINSLLMLLGDYKTPYFATIKQINDAGGRVKKGSKSTQVYFHDCIYKDKNGARLTPDVALPRIKAGDPTVKKYPFIRLFPVFNMDCVDGCPIKPAMRRNETDNHEIAACADFVTALKLGNQLRHAPIDEAFFHKKDDYVQMPPLDVFRSSELYYGVLFHELAHWTGHADRLNRKTLTESLKFGDTNYSLEELTAELGSTFLCNTFGIDTPDTLQNQAAYIANWLGVLKKNSRFIWDAASDAQAAFTYLIDRAGSY